MMREHFPTYLELINYIPAVLSRKSSGRSGFVANTYLCRTSSSDSPLRKPGAQKSTDGHSKTC